MKKFIKLLIAAILAGTISFGISTYLRGENQPSTFKDTPFVRTIFRAVSQQGGE